MRTCDSPVVFIVFNRPQQTRAVFDRIAQVRPRQLLVIADGPRTGRAEEARLCSEVRQIATAVDWPCTLLTNFSETNLGCRSRVVSGLNWAFEQVSEAIVLEDDILPDTTFFQFCEEMLDRFRDDARISMISGFNIIENPFPFNWSYYFSRLTHIWGWATWRSSWARYDEKLSTWPAVKKAGIIEEYFRVPQQQRFWTRVFDDMYSGTGPDTWDYQWFYTNLVNHALSIAPSRNLIDNIGFGPTATHTVDLDDAPAASVASLHFPLIHPPAITPLHKLDELDGRLSRNYIPKFHHRVVRKVRRSFALPLPAPRRKL